MTLHAFPSAPRPLSWPIAASLFACTDVLFFKLTPRARQHVLVVTNFLRQNNDWSDWKEAAWPLPPLPLALSWAGKFIGRIPAGYGDAWPCGVNLRGANLRGGWCAAGGEDHSTSHTKPLC